MKNLTSALVSPLLALAALLFSALIFSTLLLSGDSLSAESHQVFPKDGNREAISSWPYNSAPANADETLGDAVQINFEKAVGGLYATVPRPLWDLIVPVEGYVSSGFGLRNGSQHNGVDIASARGTLVRSIQNGIVTRVGELGGYGFSVDVDHGDNVVSRYAHLSSYPVSAGEVVAQGDIVGAIGSTGNSGGNHLHVEIHINGIPVNPAMYIPLG